MSDEGPKLEAVDDARGAEDRPRRGILLLPNLITTGALFSGFYAIVAGMNGRFIAAALAIYVAAVLDTLDGRVARWTRTESPLALSTIVFRTWLRSVLRRRWWCSSGAWLHSANSVGL